MKNNRVFNYFIFSIISVFGVLLGYFFVTSDNMLNKGIIKNSYAFKEHISLTDPADYGYATPANVSNEYDNKISLEEFSFSDYLVPGSDLRINYKVSGSVLTSMKINFKNIKSDKNYNVTADCWGKSESDEFICNTMTIPKNMESGVYEVYELTLTGLNSNYTKFTKTFSKDAHNGTTKYNFDKKLNVFNASSNLSSVRVIDSYSLENASFSPGDKIISCYNCSDLIVKLSSENGNTFNLNSTQYMLYIPDNVVKDTYYVESISGTYDGKPYTLDYTGLERININVVNGLDSSNKGNEDNNDDVVVRFTKSSMIYTLLCLAGVIIIGVSIAFAVVVMKKRKKEVK